MASSFSTLGIELIATGEASGLWGDKTTVNLQMFQEITSGYVAKSIAGGFPLSMLVGKKQIMDKIGKGYVVHGGSYNSNLMSISAAYAVLSEIDKHGPDIYNHLNGLGLHLMMELKKIANKLNINLRVSGPGSFFSIYFSDKAKILNWRDHARFVDHKKYSLFAKYMLLEKIRLSSIGRVHISVSHTEEDINCTIKSAHKVLKKF